MSKSWFFVAFTLIATVCGQLVLKYALKQRGPMPDGAGPGAGYILSSLKDPLVILSLLLAVAAALSWMAAISRLSLGVAYPFMSLAFVFVVLASALVLHHPVSATCWVGVGMVVIGLTLVAQG